MNDDTLLVGHRALPQGFEFHLSRAREPSRSLCGVDVESTQIPAYFYGVDSAIEGRWCTRCEALSKRVVLPVEVATPGDAPCV